MIIDTQADFLALLDRLRGQPELAIDCEFQREGRYHPLLCLVQIAAGDDIVAIDPFAIDLAPLGDVLADPSVLKVLHSAENDIPLLASATGQPVRHVFDTQIAAAFVGHGASPGYTLLVDRICGVALSKQSRFTDWVARPLAEEQVAYALDDVRHLLQVAAALRADLARRGRQQWAALAVDDMLTKAHRPRDRARLYLKLGPLKGMSARQLAVLREVADWRDRRASSIDRPLQSVAPDEALRQLAFEPPRTAADVARLRGLQRVGSGVPSLLAAVRRGLELPAEACPPVIEPRPRDDRIEIIASLLATALRIRASELEIAPAMIASRYEIEDLVEWHLAGRPEPMPEIAHPGGWQRAAAGEALLAVLDGGLSLRVQPDAPNGVALCESLRPPVVR
ncbi:HRDC domain-containing protein [Oscillochloris sp. ZM17-4]|uniref:ribonuclease D n=1 Tax=Oscillochloris sp. ZM17-4 TaxID=2866714 RepID=UPI001C72D68D|nr:HRDC domain-containing protein [Oscillochloris sp. ZM17-4]MBX0328474.1 HRDC domain-containing protein [Oscillochloris sp. ZM17-4]